MKPFTICLLALLAVLQYRLWVGEGSYAQVHSLGKEVRNQQQRQAQLLARNQQIFEEIDALKVGTLAIEQRARSELGMIKEGETFYVLIDQQ